MSSYSLLLAVLAAVGTLGVIVAYLRVRRTLDEMQEDLERLQEGLP